MAAITLLEAINIFEAKLKKGKKHFVYDAGLCENLSVIMSKFAHFEIKKHARTWKRFSGEDNFPIGSEAEYLHHKEFETLWVGDQLKLRMLLLAHIKKSLEAEK